MPESSRGIVIENTANQLNIGLSSFRAILGLKPQEEPSQTQKQRQRQDLWGRRAYEYHFIRGLLAEGQQRTIKYFAERALPLVQVPEVAATLDYFLAEDHANPLFTLQPDSLFQVDSRADLVKRIRERAFKVNHEIIEERQLHNLLVPYKPLAGIRIEDLEKLYLNLVALDIWASMRKLHEAGTPIRELELLAQDLRTKKDGKKT